MDAVAGGNSVCCASGSALRGRRTPPALIMTNLYCAPSSTRGTNSSQTPAVCRGGRARGTDRREAHVRALRSHSRGPAVQRVRFARSSCAPCRQNARREPRKPLDRDRNPCGAVGRLVGELVGGLLDQEKVE